MFSAPAAAPAATPAAAPPDPVAQRLERFVDAARALAQETGNAAFTVQQVVERAGLSLKSFYRCFRGKDDLLLALLEEDGRVGARILAGMVDRHDDPEARLRAFVRGIFAMLSDPRAVGYAAVLVREHRRLAEHHPHELRAALSPLLDLLTGEVEAAAARGAVRATDPARDAATVFGLLLGAIHEIVLGPAGATDPRAVAEYLWGFCRHGLAGDGTGGG